MAQEIISPQATILLSVEEVRAVLNTLQAARIAGLDPDPLLELTPEQRALVLIVAERALRARALAQAQDGKLMLHRALLTAVGVCAYPQSVVAAYHWASGAGAPSQFFGHTRDNDAVSHTLPEPLLHHFALWNSKNALIEATLDFCEIQSVANPEPVEFEISSLTFAEAREQAVTGESVNAVKTLADGGVSVHAATALVQTLADAPRVSVFQTVKQISNPAAATREFTLMQNGHQIWWVMPTASEPNAPLYVRTTTRSDLHGRFAEWL